jgi:hypothetical protein
MRDSYLQDYYTFAVPRISTDSLLENWPSVRIGWWKTERDDLEAQLVSTPGLRWSGRKTNTNPPEDRHARPLRCAAPDRSTWDSPPFALFSKKAVLTARGRRTTKARSSRIFLDQETLEEARLPVNLHLIIEAKRDRQRQPAFLKEIAEAQCTW